MNNNDLQGFCCKHEAQFTYFVSLISGRELASRVNRRVLRWFSHVGEMGQYRMARKVQVDSGSK